MKLYYLPGACSLADHIVLEWIGLPYEAIEVPRAELKTRFLEINPNGAVPVLEHDGWRLTQNVAILNYLSDSSPQHGLNGDGSAKGRAEVNRWLGFLNSDLHPAFKPLFGATAYLEDAEAIEKSKQHAKKTVAALYARVDTHLAGRDWLVDTRSIADAYLFVTLRWARGVGIDLSGMDNLARFFTKLESDPAVRKVLKQENPA